MFSSNLRSPVSLFRFIAVTALGFSLDLWTKSLAVARLRGAGPLEFVHHWLQFEYTENHGAVFGIAQGQRWMFLLVSAAALIFLTYLFANSGKRWGYQIILALLLAGVLGNMYDRVTLGYVRDMIHGLPGWQWPGALQRMLPLLPREVFPWIFNVADSLLCTGVGLMLIYSFFESKPAVSPTTEPNVATL